jgi:hypothetical protein
MGCIGSLLAAHNLLERATVLLPLSEEELIYKGIAASVTERLLELHKTKARLERTYGALETLE